jgi:hypothetical protein
MVKPKKASVDGPGAFEEKIFFTHVPLQVQGFNYWFSLREESSIAEKKLTQAENLSKEINTRL